MIRIAVKHAVEYAASVQPQLENCGLKARIAHLKRFLKVMRKNRAKLSATIYLDTGKAKTQIEHEIDIVDQFTRWMIKNANRSLGKDNLSIPWPLRFFARKKLLEVYRPWGVITSITSSNMPFAIPAYDVLAGTLAGNAIVLKPHELTLKTGLLLERFCAQAGFPKGVVQVIAGGYGVGLNLVSESDKTFFTGSSRSAASVLLQAKTFRKPKPRIECGSSNAAIVLESANLERAANAIFEGRFYNSGQSCNAIKRVIVVEKNSERSESIAQLINNKLENIDAGDDYENERAISNLIDEKQSVFLDRVVTDAIVRGAIVEEYCLCGEDELINFYFPTIIKNATPAMLCMQEEVFGPILVITSVQTIEEALKIANDKKFELLGVSIFGEPKECQELTHKLRTQTVVINDALIEYAIPSIPFGVHPNFIHGIEGLRAFTKPPQRILVSPQKPKKEIHWMPYKKGAAQKIIHIFSRISK